MAYSVDFRKRALDFMDEGHTYAQLYASFKIYPAAIEDWRKLLEQTGSLKPQ
jgi:transposase-like protein